MRNWWDLQSLLYLIVYVGLITAGWCYGLSWLAYGLLLFVAIGLQIIHHNHVHVGIWRSRRLNRFTCTLISTITAIPSAMMLAGHVKNHHRHRHGPDDVTRTYRFGGDHNHAAGYLLHPFQAFAALLPLFWEEFRSGWRKRTRFARDLVWQTMLIGLVWGILLAVDWQKCLVYVLIPQAFGWHWLLAANYFQHAHCDDQSDANYARNFTGAINWLWFNIGFHTAHHDHPTAHWSALRGLHARVGHGVDPRLNHRSFAVYFAKTFVLSPLAPRLRSKTLRRGSESTPPDGTPDMPRPDPRRVAGVKLSPHGSSIVTNPADNLPPESGNEKAKNDLTPSRIT